MGLYDAVDRGGAAPKKEKTLRRPLLIAAAVFAAVIALGVWACRYHSSTAPASPPSPTPPATPASTGAFTVTVDGAAVSADADDLAICCASSILAGAQPAPGRLPTDPPLITIDYGDGTTLDIWQVPLKPRQRLDGRPLLPLHLPRRKDLRLRYRPDPHDPPHPPVLIDSQQT